VVHQLVCRSCLGHEYRSSKTGFLLPLPCVHAVSSHSPRASLPEVLPGALGLAIRNWYTLCTRFEWSRLRHKHKLSVRKGLPCRPLCFSQHRVLVESPSRFGIPVGFHLLPFTFSPRGLVAVAFIPVIRRNMLSSHSLTCICERTGERLEK